MRGFSVLLVIGFLFSGCIGEKKEAKVEVKSPKVVKVIEIEVEKYENTLKIPLRRRKTRPWLLKSLEKSSNSTTKKANVFKKAQ